MADAGGRIADVTIGYPLDLERQMLEYRGRDDLLRRWVVSGLVVRPAGLCGGASVPWLGAPDRVAPGVELYRSSDETLVDGAGPDRRVSGASSIPPRAP